MRRDVKVHLAAAKHGSGKRAVILMTLTALLVMIFAAGCAKTPPTERPAVDLQTAKSTTMETERDMIGIIAPEDIVEIKQNETSSLLGCSDGEYAWTGQIVAHLQDGVDGPAYVQKIKEAWSQKGDWNVAQRTTAQGVTVVDISNAAGYSHGVDYSEKHHVVRIMSFSPCVILDPPYEYGTEY